MGIAPYVAEAIIREHQFKPITGTVLLLGRQTMFFSPEDALKMMRVHRVDLPTISPDEIEIDRQTLRSGEGPFILDEAFFRLLGVPKIRALDHSDYEGADIIHDLNHPLPDHLEGIADFILDGSTLDNLFNPAQGLMNIARMLKPGGRLIGVNMGSSHRTAYSVFTPYWFLDYFAINDFVDCRIYPTLHSMGGLQVLSLDPLARIGQTLPTNLETGTLIFAEKGAHSTWDRTPDQRHYASDETHAAYQAAGRRFKESSRPHLLRSARKRFVPLLPFWSLLDQAKNFWQVSYLAPKFFRTISPDGVELPIRRPRIVSFLRRLRGTDHAASGSRS
jgi:hypothetical protein